MLRYAMPLFEYACRGCGHHFEFLTRDGQSPACPACAGADLQKQLSAFAVGGNGPDKRFDSPAAGGGCGHCGDPRGPGSCSMN
jgi:putative FmdB family regulatory protein